MENTNYSYGFKSQNNECSDVRLQITGTIPEWLQGTLIRTAPSKFEVGNDSYRHWFDGLAMLHKFEIRDQQATYSSKFLESEVYKKAMKKGRIAHGEFGTDPCRDLFQRVFSFFKGPTPTDNGCVNIIKYGSDVASCTETPNPKVFDLENLATTGNFRFEDKLPGQLTPVHPHIDNRGNIYSYLTEIAYKSFYHIYEAPAGSKERRLIASIPTKDFAYIHSFGMTENYVVFLENPLVATPLEFRFLDKPFIEKFKWKEDRGTIIHLVHKSSGEVNTIRTDAFFCFHHANAFEQDGEIIFDLITYEDASIVSYLYLDELRASNPSLAAGKLWRYSISTSSNEIKKRLLTELPLELPRTNYRDINTKPYQYVYAAANLKPGNFLDALAKIDVNTGKETIWQEEGCYPGEPVFVPQPAAISEDDGVILSVVLNAHKSNSSLLILNARNLQEIARAEVPQHITFGFHGQFFSS
jgi:beta,beta-carotene 9',10'-dioxygenase